MQTQRVTTFRGIWRAGAYFHAGDISVVGPFSFEALIDHVAGTQSEPNRGGSWAQFWKPSDGVVSGVAPQPQTVVPFPVQVAAPVAPLPVAFEPPPFNPPVPLGPAPLPTVPRGELVASEIQDDGQEGVVNVAVALDALRQGLRQAARQMDVQTALGALAERLVRLERLLDARDEATLDPVIAEAWRRKCDVLQVATIAEAGDVIMGQLQETVRLLRKRDKGGTFTELEAARIAVLDVIDAHLNEIDKRAAVLMLETPPDVTAERHWPQLGAPS